MPPSRADRLAASDFIIIAFSPILIMGMLISLSFFLVEIFYRGQYQGQLLYALTWFVMAIVLITRIALEGNRAGAWLYALILAFVTMLIILRFVEIPRNGPLGPLGQLLPFGIMALIWWSADRLTKDCTHSGDESEAGLLDFGFSMTPQQGVIISPNTKDKSPDSNRKPKDKSDFVKQYEQEREQERRKHRPGTWVIYFSLAALPLFGLGQALIPPSDAERRRYTFWLLSLYVGCGLGLLLTTCFLGLRRYLRQRRMNMPIRMTGTFLTVGIGIILTMLFIAAWLPRPGGEVGLSTLIDFKHWFQKDKKQASDYAMVPGGGGEGEGANGGEGDSPKSRSGSKGQSDPHQSNSKTKSGTKGSGQGGQGEQSDADGQSDSQGTSSGGRSTGENRGSKGTQDNQNSSNRDQKTNQSSDPNKRKSKPQGSPINEQDPDGSGTGGRDRETQEEDRSSNSQAPSTTFTSSSKWAMVISIIILALFVVLGLFFLIKHHRAVLAWFNGLAKQLQDWWHWLWQEKQTTTKAPVAQFAADIIDKPIPPPPFHTFRNPFEHMQDFQSSEDIIRYSLAALHSWAYEQKIGRQPHETPLEFVQRLGEDRANTKQTCHALAMAYVWITYAKGAASQKHVEVARQFWQQLPPLQRHRQAEPATV